MRERLLRLTLKKTSQQPKVAGTLSLFIHQRCAGHDSEPAPESSLTREWPDFAHHSEQRQLHRLTSVLLLATAYDEQISKETPEIEIIKLAKRLFIATRHAPRKRF